MYVLSALPLSQQSVAGSIMQTVSKLCVAISYGVSTAVYNAVQTSPSKSGYYANDPAQPYAAAIWVAVGFGSIGVILVPFLTIHTQGHKEKEVANSIQAPDANSMHNTSGTRENERQHQKSQD
jgi:hypothetical protein